MRSAFVLLSALSLSVLFATSVSREAQGAGGHCTVRDRIQLDQAGYTKAEVDDFCDQNSTDIPFSHSWGILAGEGQPRWVQWCVTPQGRCSINPTMGYYPIGSACNCYMPWGSYGGVAQ